MTETTLEVRPAAQLELDQFARLGMWLAAAESGQSSPEAKGAAAALRIYYAVQLGLPPLAAAELSVIKGRVFVGAKLLRALAARAGLRVVRVYSTHEKCTAAVVDRVTGEELGRTDYTIEDAKKAGLIRGGSAWETHPARMLWARASKYALDDYAPEVTLGIWTAEEGDEIAGQPTVIDAEDQEDIPWPDALADDPPNPSDYPPAGADDDTAA